MNLTLALIGAIWACGTLVYNVSCECNRIRDRVILDHDPPHQIPPEHREHLMRNDWFPYALSVSLICLGFAVLAACTPLLLSEGQKLAWPIAIWVSCFSLTMGIIWIPAARRDWRAMQRAISSHYDKSRNT